MTEARVPVTVEDDDGPCTTCYDSGITIQTERACSCAAGDQYRPRPPATVPVTDDALVEKVAAALEAAWDQSRDLPPIDFVQRDREELANAVIAIAYPAGVAAGREEAAAHLEAEATLYRHAQDNANSPGDKLYRMGQKDACLLEAAAIRQMGGE